MKFLLKIIAYKKYNIILFPVISLIGFVLSAGAYAESKKNNSESVLIQGGWLIDAVSDERRKNTGIIIDNGKIIAVDTGANDSFVKTARTINLSDTDTVLPGMIDMHAHYNFDLVDIGRVEEVIYNGIIFLANGVTSTWSAGEYYPERVIQQRDLIDAGKMIGPGASHSLGNQ